LVNNGDGTFTYTPDAEFNGGDGFTYEVCDAALLCDTADVTIDVTFVNDPPVANDDTAATNADTPVTIDVVANDTDPDGNLVPGSATATSGPTSGGLVNNGDGTFEYTPDPGFSGGDTFTYDVCDIEPLCDTGSVSITVSGGVPTTFVAEIVAGSDDAEEFESGGISLTSSDLEFVVDRGSNQVVGMRWIGVDIPQGATITNAWVQFQVDEANSVATNLTIEGQAADSAATFTSTSFNVSSRSRTAAAVSWAPVPWTSVGARGPDQQTPDLTAVIQEIVNRPGWVSGNALALIVSGTGERVAESANSSANAPPEIHIEYLAAPVPNRRPVANDDFAGTTVDAGVLIDVVANDTDPDGNLVPGSAVATVGPTSGSLVNNGDGTFSYTPNTGFSGGDGFTYEVCDTEPLCDTGSVAITVTAGVPVTFVAGIAAGSDDAEEFEDGSIELTSSDLEFVVDRGSNQVVGMRWVGVGIPQGAVITDAWVQFQVDEATSVPTNLAIYGQAVDNAGTFTTALFNISSRPRTGASVGWAPVAWNTVGARGIDQQTPDLTAVIQEIVSRPGWASGNALALIVTGTGERVAESANSSANAPPEIHIEYLVP
jgi:hypothetical protein